MIVACEVYARAYGNRMERDGPGEGVQRKKRLAIRPGQQTGETRNRWVGKGRRQAALKSGGLQEQPAAYDPEAKGVGAGDSRVPFHSLETRHHDISCT